MALRIEGRLGSRVRSLLRARRRRADGRVQPWPTAQEQSGATWTSCCNICGWHGDQFASPFHSEGAQCPHCGSIARDRFLIWCWVHRTAYHRSDRVLETSPRLGVSYREQMARHVDHVCSDFDESAHKGTIKLDLQNIDLPDASVNVILTPHVLEHVPNTASALTEMFRILQPGGRMFLQVPMPQGVTAPPTVPEFHGDNTAVFWRFGWDIRDQIERAGFVVDALVTAGLKARIEGGDITHGYVGPDCDEVDLLAAADPASLTPIASDAESLRYGFLPDYHFITWDALKPT